MERKKQELAKEIIRTQSAEIIPLEIGKDKKKELYLKYFPAYGEAEKVGFWNIEEKSSFLEAQEKDCCVYCGNTHVRRYGQEDIFVCEDCRKWFMINQQEFLMAATLTRKNLEMLFGIVFKKEMTISCKVVRYQWQKRKKRRHAINIQGSKVHFGQEWIDIKLRDENIEFVVYEGLPKPTFIFIVATVLIDIFFKDNGKNSIIIRTIGLWNCLEIDGLVKWYAIHYMYLNGYMNFCRWRDNKEVEDANYKKWGLLLGSPVTKHIMSEKKLANMLIRKTKML